MTALGTYTPGVASSSSDSFTQTNTKFAGKPPTMQSSGYCRSALAENELVGRVTITGELIRSVPTASDGSQNPIGVTAYAADPTDSNSAVDSNSGAGANAADNVRFFTDGVFNFDVLVKDSGWTLDDLRRNLELNGQGFTVDVIQTASPTSADS